MTVHLNLWKGTVYEFVQQTCLTFGIRNDYRNIISFI